MGEQNQGLGSLKFGSWKIVVNFFELSSKFSLVEQGEISKVWTLECPNFFNFEFEFDPTLNYVVLHISSLTRVYVTNYDRIIL